MSNVLKSAFRRPYRYLQNMVNPVPPGVSNIEENRTFWDNYAERWDRRFVRLDDPEVDDAKKADYLECLGDEWGRKEDLERVLEEFLYPYVTRDTVAGEIGSGGGRVARRVASRVRKLYCFDISRQMLQKAQQALSGFNNVEFVLQKSTRLESPARGSFDFLYSFDVFVHLDLHAIWAYFREIHAALGPKGRAFLHTSNLRAPNGWAFFAKQDHYSATSHYFIVPEIIDVLAERAGFRLERRSQPAGDNFYLNRDYLFVLEKQ